MTGDIHHPFAAVLTGDLVGSRDTPAQLDTAISALGATARDISDDCQIPVYFDRYRGDGWQMFLPSGQAGLRAALRVIAALTASKDGLATRLALGLGEANLPPNNDIGAGHGVAFILAGDLLEAQDKAQRLSLPTMLPQLHALGLFLDWHARHWTATQAAALYEALRVNAPTQREIADKLGITRQAVQQRLAGTAMEAIQAAINAFETDIPNIWPDTDKSPL